MNLAQLNTLPAELAKQAFLQCCTAEVWVTSMVEGRPYENLNTMKQAADTYWKNLAESDYLQAFDGHPKIGDVNSLRDKYAHTKALASHEQSAVEQASEHTLHMLATANNTYFDRFGFIFIVFATGKSANDMLALLNARIHNTRETEISNAAEEQRKIFQLRIEKLV